MTRHLEWQRETRRPGLALPALSCDCAVHLFDPAHAHRLLPVRRYEPPQATLAQMQHMHATLGIGRAVLVQPAVYGADHTLLIDALKSAPARYRGVALLDDSVSDAACETLHAAGVRSARFNILARAGTPFEPAAFLRNARRAAGLGWSLSLHATLPELVLHAPLLLALDMPVVIDHVGYLTSADTAGAGWQFLREALGRGNWWVKLSRADHRFRPPYDDAVDLLQRVVALAPDRMVWATDWPHPLYDAESCVMPNDADLVELLARIVPDAAQREQVLVHNPAKLFGFANP